MLNIQNRLIGVKDRIRENLRKLSEKCVEVCGDRVMTLEDVADFVRHNVRVELEQVPGFHADGTPVTRTKARLVMKSPETGEDEVISESSPV